MRKSLSSGSKIYSKRGGGNKIKIEFSDRLPVLGSGAGINVTQVNIFGVFGVENNLNFLFWRTCLYPKISTVVDY